MKIIESVLQEMKVEGPVWKIWDPKKDQEYVINKKGEKTFDKPEYAKEYFEKEASDEDKKKKLVLFNIATEKTKKL